MGGDLFTNSGPMIASELLVIINFLGVDLPSQNLQKWTDELKNFGRKGSHTKKNQNIIKTLISLTEKKDPEAFVPIEINKWLQFNLLMRTSPLIAYPSLVIGARVVYQIYSSKNKKQ